MRNGLFFVCLFMSLTACGVNPDRMAALEKRNAEVAEGQNAAEIKVEYSDSDPKVIRDAVTGLSELEANLGRGQYDAYAAKRYEITTSLSPDVSPDVEDHDKRAQILARVAQLDLQLALIGGGRATKLVGKDRVGTASADALYAIQDAVDACARGIVSRDEQMSADLLRKFDAGLERAKSLDPSSLSYSGRRPSGMGMIDVPVEVAVCDAKVASRKIEAADAPPVAADLSKEVKGCAAFDVTIEAAQTSANAFGEFELVDASRQPAAISVACEKLPDVSDAPSNVQRAIKEKVVWLMPGDLVSMAGPFEYDQRDTLYKRGVARIFRRDATLRTNKCGTQDATTCEAEGSLWAQAINRGQHYLVRADFYRTQKNPDRCRAMADLAYKSLGGSLAAPTDAKILLSSGDVISKTEAQSRLEALKSQANDVLATDWCANP